jgi:hypothetical protein
MSSFSNNLIQDRVLYEPKRIQLLGSQAYESNSPFNVTDRIGLVSDAMVLAKSGMALTSAGLSLINEMKKETECEPFMEDISRVTIPHTFNRSCVG